MIRRLAWSLSSCLALALLPGCAPATPSGAAESMGELTAAASTRVEFVLGFEAGYHEARRQGKPMLLLFTMSRCDHCQRMVELSFADDRVLGLSERFVCVQVDADDDPGVCQEFRVRAYPTVQFFSARGVPLNRLTGETPGGQLAIEMQAALQAVARRDGEASATTIVR